jgi:hypothetical protein
MRGKMWFFGGMAVGFVVGSRAGRERYDQLVKAARQLWDHPTVQEAAGVVQAQANRLYAEGKDTVSEKLSNSRLGDRLSHRTGEADELAGTTTDVVDTDPLANAAKRPPGSTF